MTDDFRKRVKMRIAFDKDITQTQLAENIGVSRQYVNRVLNGSVGKMPDVWQDILDELDMVAIAIPKEKLSEVNKALAN